MEMEEMENQTLRRLQKSGLQICGTFGPSCHEEDLLADMIGQGMNAMRLNTNHCTLEEGAEWIGAWHRACERQGISGLLLVDLQKGSLRTTLEEAVDLKKGEVVSSDLLGLPEAVFEEMRKNDVLLLDDGRIQLEVQEAGTCLVMEGGLLENHKNVCLQNRMLERPSLSEQDLQTLQEASRYGVAGIMVPFVEGAADLKQVRALVERWCPDVKIFAKIETARGVRQLNEILPWCDEIVMARGDLGNDVGLTKLPAACERIRQQCLAAGKPWMVVTQMLDSMRHHPEPTRAEVSDIYHAVADGAHSIMLTNETATGEYPLEAMGVFCQVAASALEGSPEDPADL